MVGLNDEMGRELLWRQFPTDQRGSYFRQFWDVGDAIESRCLEAAAQVEEELLDITKLHTWDRETRARRSHARQPPFAERRRARRSAARAGGARRSAQEISRPP